MKIYAYKIIITLLYFNVISCDDNIICNGTILFDHYNLTKMELNEKKLDVFCGDEMILLCQLDEVSLQNGCISSNLNYDFGINDEPPENTKIQLVNNKTLQLKINTNKSVDFTVTCRYNDKGLNSLVMSINIGHKPQPIEIQCLVDPHHMLKCEFEMSGNPVMETYEILYSNHSTQPALYDRAVFETKDKKRKWSIKLSKYESFDPFGKFTFLVTGTNRFGVLPQNFTFQTKQIVDIPKQKYVVGIRKIEAKSVVVVIILPEFVKIYEFTYSVTACIVRCYIKENWFQVNVADIITDANNQIDFSVNLNISLPHAYQTYKLQIKVQLKNALYPAKQQIIIKPETFKTIEFPPEYPPTTFMNGFEIRQDNDVILYWKEILDIHKNGPDFKYQVGEIYENGQVLSNVHWIILSNSTGRLKNLNRNKNYQIRLVSRNSAGISNNRNDIIQIPRATDCIPPPDHMRKTLNNDRYDLSWKPSPLHDIISYTIYWCSPLEELQSMCDTLLGYKILLKHQTTFQYYNTPKSGMKNFAIAANTKNSSSGLYWFICPIKFTIKVTDYTDSNITLNWTMPCHVNRKTDVIISYCKSDPYTSTICGTNKKQIISAPSDQESLVLSKLHRCTSYLIKIQNPHEKSTELIVINARTSKGAPPTPIALKHSNITNTTIEISWQLPYECPGSKWYRIICNKMEPITFHSNDSKSYTIENLISFTMYDIKIAVCYEDMQCSKFSSTINVKTIYGTPAGINKWTTDVNNDGFTFYSWQTLLQNAEFQYYEVKHIFTQDDIDTELTSIVSIPKCTLVKFPCDGKINYKQFARVINIDRMINHSYDLDVHTAFKPTVCFEEIPHNITTLCNNVPCLIGKWSKYGDFYCGPENLVMKFSVLLVIVLVIGAGFIVGILIGIRKYQSIKNVGHVSMPDGLDSIFKSRSKSNLNQKSEPAPMGESNEEYCTYEYIFSSAYRLDQISVTDSMATSENQDDYLEYSCDVVPLPNPGNYVKFNDLQNQQKLAISGYTSVSALQSQRLPNQTIKEEIQLSCFEHKIPNSNGYRPVSDISAYTTPASVKMNGYGPIQMLHAIKPQQMTIPSSNYTPVSALQQNSMKLPTFSTNGYITIAALQSQTS